MYEHKPIDIPPFVTAINNYFKDVVSGKIARQSLDNYTRMILNQDPEILYEFGPGGMAGRLKGLYGTAAKKWKNKPLFHGVALDYRIFNEDAARGLEDQLQRTSNIKNFGLNKGRSAELGLYGSSLAEDPAVSFHDFGAMQQNASLKMRTDYPAEEVYNLSPSLYMQKNAPDTTGPVMYRIPAFYMNESETFATRVPYRDWPELKPWERYIHTNQLDEIEQYMAPEGKIGIKTKAEYITPNELKKYNY